PRLRATGRPGATASSSDWRCPAEPCHRGIDQVPGDADRAGQLRQRIERKPLRVRDLVVAGANLSAGVFRRKGDHERMRKRPGLAGDVLQAAYLHADFLAHFAVDAILDGLARLDESCQRTVNRLGKTPGT